MDGIANKGYLQLKTERIHPDAVIAPTAVVVGQVELAKNVNIWYHCVIRGDTEIIKIQEGTNIQDGCILHADPGFPLTIGHGCTIGHGAILHGATIGNQCVIGMGAIILNGVTIGNNTLVAAGSLLPQGKHFPSNSLIIGNPAIVKRSLTEAEITANNEIAHRYIHKSKNLL